MDALYFRSRRRMKPRIAAGLLAAALAPAFVLSGDTAESPSDPPNNLHLRSSSGMPNKLPQ